MLRVNTNKLNDDGALKNMLIHLARYNFVAGFLDKTDNVIEIGCGNGYGTRLLSEYCNDIIGIDANHDVIDSAKKSFERDNLRYYDCTRNDVYDVMSSRAIHNMDFKQADIVVSLEVIEHIEQSKQKLFLESMAKNTNANTFIISTPRYYEGRSENRKKEHTHEFEYDEFKQVLDEQFENVIVFGQNDEIITLRSKTSLRMAWNFIAVCRR